MVFCLGVPSLCVVVSCNHMPPCGHCSENSVATNLHSKKGAAESSTSTSIAALPRSDVNVTYVSTYVYVRIYVGSGRRVGNFLNTAQSL